MLKRLGLATGIALMAAPAFAADLGIVEPAPLPPPQHHIVTGHLEMAGGYEYWGARESVDADISEWLFEGAGRFNLNFNQSWNVQIDLDAVSRIDDNRSSTTTTSVAHLWYGTPTHAVGVFGGAGFGFWNTLWLAGIEGEAYFGNSALGGQLYYASTSGCCFGEWWTARLWGKHYINPDLKLFGELEYSEIRGSTSVWGITGGVEKRHTGAPFSGFATVGYTDLPIHTSWKGMVGFRLFADQSGSTLYSHDMQVPWSVRIDTGGERLN